MALSRTWYGTLINDDGSNTVGSPWEVEDVDALMDAIDAELARVDADIAVAKVYTVPAASTVTGAVNNWAPTGMSGHTFQRWAGAADATFSGLAGGAAGQVFTFKNTGTKVAYFLHQSGLSLAANKFTNAATSGATPVAAGGWLTYLHDGTDWKIAAHEQGAWITSTFSAGDFTGDGSMTWTLQAGDVTTLRWRLSGRTIVVSFVLITTTVGGTLASGLRINNGAWGGFTVAGAQYLTPNVYSDAGGALTAGYMQAGSALGGSTWFAIYKAGGAAWSVAPAPGTTSVYGTKQFDVN